MAVTATAAFAQSPVSSYAVCTAAKTAALTSTTNTVLLYTAGANGSIVVGISAVARNTVTATQLQLYLSDDSGTSVYLLATELMSAYTYATTTKHTASYFNHPNGYGIISVANPLYLSATHRLYAAIGVALTDGIVFFAQGTNL